MKRRTFIVATACLSTALAAPAIAAPKPRSNLKAKFIKVEDQLTPEGITVVKVNTETKPTPADLEHWRKVFEEAQYDKDFHFHSPPKNGHSYWEVFDGKTSLFKVTVNEIVWADPNQSFYTINSVDFGKLLLKSVRNKGVEKTKQLFNVQPSLADDDHVQYILDPPTNQEPGKRRLRHLRARKVW